MVGRGRLLVMNITVGDFGSATRCTIAFALQQWHVVLFSIFRRIIFFHELGRPFFSFASFLSFCSFSFRFFFFFGTRLLTLRNLRYVATRLYSVQLCIRIRFRPFCKFNKSNHTSSPNQVQNMFFSWICKNRRGLSWKDTELHLCLFETKQDKQRPSANTTRSYPTAVYLHPKWCPCVSSLPAISRMPQCSSILRRGRNC